MEAKMNNKKKIKIALISLVAILCVVLTTLLILNSKADGHYVAKEYQNIGVTFYIDLKGSSYEMVATSINQDNVATENRTTGTFKIKEDIITLEFEGSELVGSYDKQNKTLVINGITFSKE